jgi:hypothetical protein
LSPENKATSEFSYSFKKIVKIESGFSAGFEKALPMARFETVVPMARYEKLFPRGQEYSNTYSVRDKFTAVDISVQLYSLLERVRYARVLLRRNLTT